MKPQRAPLVGLRTRFLILILMLAPVTVVAMITPAFARRAYSYGGGSATEAVPEVNVETPVVVRKQAAPKKAAAPVKKRVESEPSNVTDDSIMNVFAAAPIDASSAKNKSAKKPGDKTGVDVKAAASKPAGAAVAPGAAVASPAKK